MFKSLTKRAFHAAGLKVEWRDRLLESITYQESPFLPRISSYSVPRLFYFRDMLETVRDVPGDVVECGTSVGYGLLSFILTGEAIGVRRDYHGYDSFAGFPAPTRHDNGTHVTEGFLRCPPDIILRVLRDGGVPEEVVRDRLHIVKGFFDQTLPGHRGRIALLHLDCDLYESYRVALENLYPHVEPGGAVLFDEYHDPHFPGADRAIDEFFAGKPEAVTRHRSGYHYVIKR